MSKRLRKAAARSLAALALAAGMMAPVTPASAEVFRGYGSYGYWSPGWGWRGGYYDWRGAVAAGLASGFALGTLAGLVSAYGPPYYGYSGCYWQNQPAYDAWGNFMGYHPVEVCY